MEVFGQYQIYATHSKTESVKVLVWMDRSCSAERARKQRGDLKSSRQTKEQSLGLVRILENGQTNPKAGVMC